MRMRATRGGAVPAGSGSGSSLSVLSPGFALITAITQNTTHPCAAHCHGGYEGSTVDTEDTVAGHGGHGGHGGRTGEAEIGALARKQEPEGRGAGGREEDFRIKRRVPPFGSGPCGGGRLREKERKAERGGISSPLIIIVNRSPVPSQPLPTSTPEEDTMRIQTTVAAGGGVPLHHTHTVSTAPEQSIIIIPTVLEPLNATGREGRRRKRSQDAESPLATMAAGRDRYRYGSYEKGCLAAALGEDVQRLAISHAIHQASEDDDEVYCGVQGGGRQVQVGVEGGGADRSRQLIRSVKDSSCRCGRKGVTKGSQQQG
ncbi:hypothetical protein DFH27DRAFT_609487 [Peziza echinospora]|nr:hypothetical protein DFH27DRAFT_609487 [Peziza echinospora]